MKQLTCIQFLCAFIIYVSSGVVPNKRHSVVRFVRDAYKYNHPPAAEYYSVPVAVVYEDGNRKEKSYEKASKENLGNMPDDDLRTLIDVEVTTPEIISDVTAISDSGLNDVNQTIPNQSTTKTATLTKHTAELEIPVAVVYDVDPKNIPVAKKSREQTKVTGRQQRNKKTTTENYEEFVKGSKNQNSSSKSDELTTRFPKRGSQERNPVVPILQSESYLFSHSGDFHYSYEGGDGTKAYERGKLRTLNDTAGEAVVGSYSYIGKDGNDYSLTYTADENGYRPIGAHLPTPPPIPPAIARALKYLATKSVEVITESYK